MWKFRFYVVEDLVCPVILGSDFLGKTGLLIDIPEGFAFFRFDSANKLSLIACRSAPDFPRICASAETHLDLSHLPHPLYESILAITDEFQDVLTPTLALMTILEYNIHLLALSPVKIPPYRLMAPQVGGIAPTRPVYVGTGNYMSVTR
jgi:hypothetical protein